MRRALVLLCLMACDGPTSPTTTLGSFEPRGNPSLSPSGRVLIWPHDWGEVVPWHLATADQSWREVSACLGIRADSIRLYPVLLYRENVPCGDVPTAGCHHVYGPGGKGHIGILGGSFDFDPRAPELDPGTLAVFSWLWRHEFTHLGLTILSGNNDASHSRPEWSCEKKPFADLDRGVCSAGGPT